MRLFHPIFNGYMETIINQVNLVMEKVLGHVASRLQGWHETLVPRKKTHHLVHTTILML
uniref:C.fusiformis plasmid pCF1 DNA for ORF218, ORF482, ORF311, ORF58 and ORF111 n=1 Tax=Cylindrotheca fusiformis TaxID=2853 RepID=Q39501_CYLFU|nr:unnamed protein product [Cylindrotheca fusiformis]